MWKIEIEAWDDFYPRLLSTSSCQAGRFLFSGYVLFVTAVGSEIKIRLDSEWSNHKCDERSATHPIAVIGRGAVGVEPNKNYWRSQDKMLK
ncbi:unnamed protein product, partial [Nesidiocoris tenuis]